jgi:hypothetical protein
VQRDTRRARADEVVVVVEGLPRVLEGARHVQQCRPAVQDLGEGGEVALGALVVQQPLDAGEQVVQRGVVGRRRRVDGRVQRPVLVDGVGRGAADDRDVPAVRQQPSRPVRGGIVHDHIRPVLGEDLLERGQGLSRHVQQPLQYAGELVLVRVGVGVLLRHHLGEEPLPVQRIGDDLGAHQAGLLREVAGQRVRHPVPAGHQLLGHPQRRIHMTGGRQDEECDMSHVRNPGNVGGGWRAESRARGRENTRPR